jgi:hypothetical protein
VASSQVGSGISGGLNFTNMMAIAVRDGRAHNHRTTFIR